MITRKPPTRTFLMPTLQLAAAFIFLTVGCVAPDTMCQSTGRATQTKRSRQQQSGAGNRVAAPLGPIIVAEPETIRLPAGYSGHSAVNIFASLIQYRADLAKSQFETAEAYRNRRRSIIQTLLLKSGRTASDRLTFVIPATDITYDADTEILNLKLETDSYFYADTVTDKTEFDPELNEFVTTELDRNTRSLGSAVGQNAFGIRRRYQIKRYVKHHLALLRQYIDPWSGTIMLPLEVEKARRLDGRLRIALTGQMVSPYLGYNTSRDTATITDPEEAHFHDLYLFFQPDALVVYDLPTGDVLGSIDLIKVSQTSDRPSHALRLGQESDDPQNVSPPSLKSPEREQDGPPLNRERVISGGVLNGKAISKPQPAYPPIAKAARASGTVTVQVTVDEEGRVISARAAGGHPLLQQAAVAAARQARFSPTLLSGQPVKVSGVITYKFDPQ